MSTSYNETNPGVFKYNIDNNNLEKIIKYDDCLPSNHGQFIDYTDETLHILDSVHITMDLKTKTITNKQTFNCGHFPKCVEIPSTKGNQIHILSDYKNHFNFDCKNKIITEIDSNKDALFDDDAVHYLKLLYVESKKQLMILGGDRFDEIYYCNINEPFEWKLMNNIKMPHWVNDECYYDVLLFGDVIIVFYFDEEEDFYDIWCLDLLYFKWYKSKYDVPKSVGECSHFIKSNNDIHVLSFTNQQHFITNIHNVFPTEIIKQRRKHFELLVIGFVKNEEKNIVLNIPWPLKQLILLYFPLFC